MQREAQMAGVPRTHPWELSDALWARAQPLLPAPKPHPKGGRPARGDREMLGAMLYVLRTGIQWNALPRSIGASTTVYDRLLRLGARRLLHALVGGGAGGV